MQPELKEVILLDMTLAEIEKELEIISKGFQTIQSVSGRCFDCMDNFSFDSPTDEFLDSPFCPICSSGNIVWNIQNFVKQ